MPEKPQIAWQPLTFGGVAAFARASVGRLLLVQTIFALMTAVVVAWFLSHAWFPTIHQAIQQLPAESQIRSGTLHWPTDSPLLLAESPFLAIAVDLNHQGHARSPAHVQIELGQHSLRIFSLFGYLEVLYPQSRNVPFNRTELVPWWGAWVPPILGIAAAAVIGGSLVGWAFFATLYMWPAWVIGFFSDRDLKLSASWRLAGASLMPGAILLSAAILFYGLGAVDLVQLVAASLVHLIVGWIYLFGGVLATPQHAAAETSVKNPFAPSPAVQPNASQDRPNQINSQ